jgi:hypothetical protein
LWSKLFGGNTRRELLQFKEQIAVYSSEATQDCASHDEALVRFYGEFEALFGERPQMLAENERALVMGVSKRVWDSVTVQMHPDPRIPGNKYDAYKELMTEFFSGTHMVFLEEEGESFVEELKASHVQPLERVSSHYVQKVGDAKHLHLMGKQLPEVLFHEGMYYYDNNGLKLLPDHALSGDQLSKKRKVLWIQTERTPDGPKWSDLLYHRSVDFVQYFVLKNIFKVERPQIARYVGPNGRSLPDKQPIVLRQPRNKF